MPPVIDAARTEKLLGLGGLEFLSEAITQFRTTAAQTMTSLLLACTDDQADGIRHAAHRLKGSCMAIGAARATAICETLEEQARQGTLHGSMALVGQLRHELAAALQHLQQLVDDRP